MDISAIKDNYLPQDDNQRSIRDLEALSEQFNAALATINADTADLRDRIDRLSLTKLDNTEKSVKATHIDFGRKNDQVQAKDIPIMDTGKVFTATTVEDALAETVSGSGTADYIPKWSDADTLTDSVMQEASGKIGINCVPDTTLEVTITDSVSNDVSYPLRITHKIG